MAIMHFPSGAGHSALRKCRHSQAQGIYLVTTTTNERWPAFSDHRAAFEACRCFHDRLLLQDASILAWVLMPDHVHWLLRLGDSTPLQDMVDRLKSASARRVNRSLGRRGPLWSRAYHERAVRAEEDLPTIARYIVANPLRAGLVERIGDYPYWNAIWL